MAAPAQQEKPSALVIGQAFAEQYYTVLHQSPDVVFRFYQENSKLGRPQDGGSMGLTTGMTEIGDKITSYGKLKAHITSVDAQESYCGGVIVLITGHMTKEGDKRQSFTQSFFLAPQEVGYFVLNDIFRCVENGHSEAEKEDLANDVVEPDASDQEVTPVQNNEIVHQPEEVNGGEVYDPSDDGEGSVVEQEELEPVAVVVNEVPVETEAVLESESKSEEDAPKKTYASIVKVMKVNAVQMPAPAPVKSTPKVQHQQQVIPAPPPASVTENVIANPNVAEGGSNQDGEGEGFSIYIKNLSVNTGPSMVEEAFIKFGPIKLGGIQVRNSKGFCFGFVEFEGPDAAQSAIEAGSVIIGGRQVLIEEKKSTNGGGNRGRFFPGRGGGFRNEGPRGGGFRNEGPRGGNYGRGGRGGYGGRGEFGRNDYGNRGNSRGGYQNRNFDGYQKVEMGNGGNRVNRGGGTAPNIVDKAQRVPATATIRDVEIHTTNLIFLSVPKV